MKPGLRVFLLLALTLSASSCFSLSKTREAAEKVVDAIEESESLAREFLYKETTDEGVVVVKGIFEDDLRYAFVVARDGLGVFETVVSDDTVAVRLLDPSVIPEIDIPDPSVLALIDELRSGAWVVDPAGAPSLEFVLAADISGDEVGKNPIRDALSLFPYIRLSVAEALGVNEWSKDDVQPAYTGVEGEYFDAPSESLGIKRFDLVRRPLPRREGTEAEASEPRIFHFRKMAVYVNDGQVVKVKEEIAFENHIQFRRAIEERKPKFLLEMLERLRKGDTEDEIRPRQMILEITPKPSAKVLVPEGTHADLGVTVGIIFGTGPDVPDEATGEQTPSPGETGGTESPAPAPAG